MRRWYACVTSHWCSSSAFWAIMTRDISPRWNVETLTDAIQAGDRAPRGLFKLGRVSKKKPSGVVNDFFYILCLHHHSLAPNALASCESITNRCFTKKWGTNTFRILATLDFFFQFHADLFEWLDDSSTSERSHELLFNAFKWRLKLFHCLYCVWTGVYFAVYKSFYKPVCILPNYHLTIHV